MLPEGTLAEVINNAIYIAPSPSFHHQDVCTELVSAIRVFTSVNRLGKCLVAPIDVYLDSQNVFQPDIVFISNGNMSIVKDEKVKGAPDLVIDILSPGNKKHDLERKKPVYEKNGVQEYFVVDPKTKEVTTFYLQNNKFVKQESKKGKVKSTLLNKVFSF